MDTTTLLAMNDTQVLDVLSDALGTAARLAGPFLLAILVVGVVVGLLQSLFQVQEQSLPMVPKFIIAAVVAVVAGQWMLDVMVGLTIHLLEQVPQFLSTG